MSEFVKKLPVIRLRAGEEDLNLIESFDVIHYWPRNGAKMLKYFDEENGEMQNVCLPEEIFQTLMEHGIPVAQREHMTPREFDLWVGAIAVSSLGQLDFEPQAPLSYDSEGNYLTGW